MWGELFSEYKSYLLNVGRVVLGRVFFGASCIGASCPVSKTKPPLKSRPQRTVSLYTLGHRKTHQDTGECPQDTTGRICSIYPNVKQAYLCKRSDFIWLLQKVKFGILHPGHPKTPEDTPERLFKIYPIRIWIVSLVRSFAGSYLPRSFRPWLRSTKIGRNDQG